MTDRQDEELGAVQSTLFIPLAARARHTRQKKPLLRDPKAAGIMHSVNFDAAKFQSGMPWVTVLRTRIFDWWVGEFLAAHPAGTVVELGTGLNTRFERTDNGTVHWVDLDLPDTIGLRRRFFADTERRRMIAASVLDEDWFEAVATMPGPYFFVSDGVLVYLSEDDITRALSRMAARFPGALLAFDTYARRTFDGQRKRAVKRGIAAPWQWACDDPRTLERLGLTLIETAAITRPPARLRARLPARYRYLLPLADPALGKGFASVSLFRAG